MKIGAWLFIILIAFIFSCDQKQNHRITLEKEYKGFWAETGWSYKFHKDGRFLFKYEGHFGDGTDTGRYTIVDDIILLIPDTDWDSELHGVLKEKIKIISANCIRDFDNNFYCLDLESINYYNQLKYNFEEKAIEVIDSLPMVIKEKKRLQAYDNISKSRFEPQIGYNSIIVVNNEEYHSFILIRSEAHHYLNFIVKEKPFQIYEHHREGDSLSLVHSE